MKKGIKIIAVISLIISVFCINFAYGSTSSSISKKQDQLEAGRAYEVKLSKQIKRLEARVSKGQSNIRSLNKKIKSNRKNIAKMKTEIKKRKADYEKGQDLLDIRLRNMYKSGSVGFIDVIFSAEDVDELISNYEMIKDIFQNDKSAVGLLKKKYTSIVTAKNNLSELNKKMNHQKQLIIDAQNEIVAEKAVIQRKENEVAEKNENLKIEVDNLKADADKISGKIKNDGGGTYTGGSLMWPTQSTYVTSPFGYRMCPFHGKEFHTGIDIAASMGSPIVAAASGTVIIAGWNGGYGKCIVINHGSSLATLYGHNSRLLVHVGQRVSRGQQIAKAGSTGNSTGSHCHFEVRVNGGYVNPMNYLR